MVKKLLIFLEIPPDNFNEYLGYNSSLLSMSGKWIVYGFDQAFRNKSFTTGRLTIEPPEANCSQTTAWLSLDGEVESFFGEAKIRDKIIQLELISIFKKSQRFFHGYIPVLNSDSVPSNFISAASGLFLGGRTITFGECVFTTEGNSLIARTIGLIEEEEISELASQFQLIHDRRRELEKEVMVYLANRNSQSYSIQQEITDFYKLKQFNQSQYFEKGKHNYEVLKDYLDLYNPKNKPWARLFDMKLSDVLLKKSSSWPGLIEYTVSIEMNDLKNQCKTVLSYSKKGKLITYSGEMHLSGTMLEIHASDVNRFTELRFIFQNFKPLAEKEPSFHATGFIQISQENRSVKGNALLFLPKVIS